MYGIIGYPLGHSFSADYFNKKFHEEGIDETYRLFPIPSIDSLGLILAENPTLKGLNVTIPYKEKVIPLLTDIDSYAKEIGAVNVIKIIRNGDEIQMIGYNSDALGFEESLTPLLKPYMKNALVLGTGGASKAVAVVLKSLGIEVTHVSRQRKENCISYDDLTKDIIDKNTLIVNTTPLGMWPKVDEAPAIPYEYLTNQHLCYDVVYNPDPTLFMQLSKEQGASVKGGLEMLHTQAVEAWKIWNPNA